MTDEAKGEWQYFESYEDDGPRQWAIGSDGLKYCFEDVVTILNTLESRAAQGDKTASALMDAAVVDSIPTEGKEPSQIIREIVAFNVQIALDPKVSEEAARLHAAAAELERVKAARDFAAEQVLAIGAQLEAAERERDAFEFAMHKFAKETDATQSLVAELTEALRDVLDLAGFLGVEKYDRAVALLARLDGKAATPREAL